MEIDADKVDGDKSFELEYSSKTEDTPTHIATLDSVLIQKLIYLPTTKASLSRTGVKHMSMEQISLYRKIDVRRLITKPENKYDCYTHKCKHYR